MASTLSSVSAVLMQLAGEVVCLHVAHWLQRFCVCAVNTGRSISDSDDERHYIAVDIGSPRHQNDGSSESRSSHSSTKYVVVVENLVQLCPFIDFLPINFLRVNVFVNALQPYKNILYCKS